MMTIRRLLSGLAVVVFASASLAVPAEAAPPGQLAGGSISNEQLVLVLNLLERASRGKVDVHSVGTTNEGRPIEFATVGHGPVRILYVTQQHGDEPLGTPAAIRALWTLGVAETPFNRRLLSQITLGVIVRANPDGHAHNWRFNFDPTADPEFGERGKGYDINRYHNPTLAPENNPVPEAAAIQRVYQSMRPSIVVDYHMQGRYANAFGREVTTSIMWPTSPATTPDAVNRSKQVVAQTFDVLTRGLGAVVSQYPGGDYEGIARNAYGILGSASMLMELSSLPKDREEFQIASAYAVMLAVASAAGDGSLTRVDPTRADTIPLRPPAIPNTLATTADDAA
jgi:hypothetical protein